MRKVLTKFSKGIKRSKALSFSKSASKNCDKRCKLFNKGCYAETVESRYPNYGKKLSRHEKIKPHNLLYLAYNELETLRKFPTWFRLSVSGSLPNKKDLSEKDWKNYKEALRFFAKYLAKKKTNIHIPVESIEKARSTRAILKDTDITVRRTCQTEKGLLKAKDEVAYVVDKGKNHNQLAQTLRKQKKSVVVCPAIIGNSKCGRCLACSSKRVKVVLYPQHK